MNFYLAVFFMALAGYLPRFSRMLPGARPLTPFLRRFFGLLPYALLAVAVFPGAQYLNAYRPVAGFAAVAAAAAARFFRLPLPLAMLVGAAAYALASAV